MRGLETNEDQHIHLLEESLKISAEIRYENNIFKKQLWHKLEAYNNLTTSSTGQEIVNVGSGAICTDVNVGSGAILKD